MQPASELLNVEQHAHDDVWQSFETFNLLIGFGQPSPHAAYAALRAEAPVHAGLPHLNMPGNNGDGPPTFSVYSYDAAAQALLDPATFSNAAYFDIVTKVMGRSLIEMDPPEHREYRSLLQPSLGPKTMGGWQSRFVTPMLEEMTAELQPAGRADLVRGFLFTFPMRTFAAILGLPPTQYTAFHRTAIELLTLSYDVDKGRASAATLADMFAPLIAARREPPLPISFPCSPTPSTTASD